MADVTVTIDDDVLEVLKELAEYRNQTLEEYLRGMLLDDIERIKERMNDPIVGAFSSKTGDISERAEEILREEWNPD